jgi:CubicO group peptidase (beta-lactamase class C family)
MTVGTAFRIGSTTKQFTAAAVLKLVEAGHISLDDPIAKYVDVTPAAWSGVTLRQLLNHTSGIPDYVRTNGFIRGPARLDLGPEELLALVREEPLASPPGAKFAYSNTGYLLLGMVIERVSRRRYNEYIQEQILHPLGLAQTAYDDPQQIVPNRASGYWLDGVLKNARTMTTSSAYASGGLRSTVDDLLAWDLVLHGGRLVSRASVQAMFTDYGHGYGFGSFVQTRHGHRLWNHGGNVPGFSSAFERYPDDGLTVIVLTNIEGPGSERIAKELAGTYFGWAPYPAAKVTRPLKVRKPPRLCENCDAGR